MGCRFEGGGEGAGEKRGRVMIYNAYTCLKRTTEFYQAINISTRSRAC